MILHTTSRQEYNVKYFLATYTWYVDILKYSLKGMYNNFNWITKDCFTDNAPLNLLVFISCPWLKINIKISCHNVLENTRFGDEVKYASFRIYQNIMFYDIPKHNVFHRMKIFVHFL